MNKADSLLREHGANAPLPYDLSRMRMELADLEERSKGAGDDVPAKEIAALLADKGARHLIEGIFGNSPFLTRAIRRHPHWLPRLLNNQPQVSLQRLKDAALLAAEAPTMPELMRDLRVAKSEAALLIAMADITGAWTLEEVTGALTAFADAAVQASVRWLLKEGLRRGQILEEISAEHSGLAVLGMGKGGAGELNYSSDIDLVIFYEPGRVRLKNNLEDSEFFIRLAQSLVKIMQERTEDGYVFRTDLRLRPDPGATPVAVSLPAAEHYYESRGQNWERAAFIKARPVAGDVETGNRFLKSLIPYIWRKNLDFAAIDDIHSMKRQIHAVMGHGTIAVAGHNVKLGRGGIREIEFFVQTQQLIAGGRDRDLRGRKTCAMLDELAAKDWIEKNTAEEMKTAYRFLRTLEHRLQMIDDQQTHNLPSTSEGLDHIAIFMGFENQKLFAAELTGHLQRVQGHYAKLFETAPPLAEEGGSLVFTGTEDDPETLETLRRLGFAQPHEVAVAIRGWHTGRFAATRSARSRELLTALMPVLLRALSKTSNPDMALTRFDGFLTGLPAGVQFFSMLYSNPSLLDLIAGICGTAPRLASYLSRNSAVLEAVLDPNFFAVLPSEETQRKSLEAVLSHARDYEDILDFIRVWAREQRFRVGVRVLSGSADAEEAGPAYASVASELVRALAPAAENVIAARFGRIPGGHFSIVAMGKLGSEEMSAASDLDLIMIYGGAKDVMSNGARPIPASQYYARVCQQLIGALTAPTAEGKLYEVDLRLRPSGNSGPIATHIDSFTAYQASEAWTWEHMALTRARILTGPEEFRSIVATALDRVLTAPRDTGKIASDVADMRTRVEREFPSQNPWELKYVRGGLLDLEFICQYLQLVHGHKHPEVLDRHSYSAFTKIAEAKLLSASVADLLIEATLLHQNLVQAIRICVEGVFDAAEATPSLKALLARMGNAPDFSALEAQLKLMQAEVQKLFKQIVVSAAAPK